MITREQVYSLLESQEDIWCFPTWQAGGDKCIDAKIIGFYNNAATPDDDKVKIKYTWLDIVYTTDIMRLNAYESKESCASTFMTYEPKTVARFCSGYERNHG